MNTHQLEPGRPLRIRELPTSGRQFHDDKETAIAEFKMLRDELAELQRRLYAGRKHKVLVVFQAVDAGGKDGAIGKVFHGVHPQGLRVHPFKKPTDEELGHDFLWRVHKVTPATRTIGVFNRSHYEDVLVVRVHNLVPESVWRPRYEQINAFEKVLHDAGITILKFFLHISKEEQKERFQARLDNPDKQWKFSFEDLEKRQLWDAYMAAYEEMLNQCNTAWAPWYAIPADQKWYRNLAVSRVIVQALKELNPQYPPPEGDLSNVIIP